MGFFDDMVGKVSDVLSDTLVPKALDLLEPKVKEEVKEAVVEFRGFVEKRIPEKAAEEVTERQSSNNLAVKLLAKALGDRADDLAKGMLRFLKPQLDETTTDLPDDLTSRCMDQLRDFLTLDDDEAGDQEVGSRDFTPEGDKEKKGALSSVGKALNLEGKLPRIRAKLHERLQPVIESLQRQIWDLVPDIFQKSVAELLEDGSDEEGGEGGGINWVPDCIEKKVEGKIVDQVPRAVRAVEEPIRDVIKDVCEFLQDKVSDKVEQQLRSVLETLHLI